MSTFAIFRTRWFWYCILTVIGWGGWAVLLKLVSMEIPTDTTQFLSTLGMLPVAAGLLVARRFQLEKNHRGILYSVVNGAMSAGGILALLAAYRSGGNTSVITVTAALYPMITVVLAVLILRERLTRLQVAALGLAAVAIVIFSL